jgi:hypothetical protein
VRVLNSFALLTDTSRKRSRRSGMIVVRSTSGGQQPRSGIKELESPSNRKNRNWIGAESSREDFLDALSKTRLLDRHHEAIRECDIFAVLLYRTSRPKHAEMAPRAGIEPATCRLGGDRSIHWATGAY